MLGMDKEHRSSRAETQPGATQQPQVPPTEAVKTFWVKAFTYSGRSTRAEYNWALLLFVIWSCIAGLLLAYIIPRPVSTILGVAFWIAFVVPWLALIARRCHDMNRPGTFGFLLLATGIGFLVTEGFLMLAESDPRGVRFDQTSQI